MENNHYWQSLEDLYQTEEYKDKASKEFEEELPILDYLDDASKQTNTGRRDFLKMMGFSLSAAALATSCKIPVRKAIPYAFNDGELTHIVPGIAKYYASTFLDGANLTNVLVKTREGRPIKIEANPNGMSGGGTSARAQASVLNLYDHTRLQAPKKGADVITWQAFDSEVKSKLRSISDRGGLIVIVSNSDASVANKAAISALSEAYSGVERVIYDPVSSSATRKANAISLGSPIIPTYRFDKADVIVGSNCDFLGSWINPVEHAKQYIKNRVPSKKNPRMSRHYQIQSIQTMTGANADYKIPVAPSQEKATLVALYNALAGRSGASKLGGGSTDNGKMISRVAADLAKAGSKGLVVSGTNDVEIQLVVNAINGLLGAYGTTINTSKTYNLQAGDDTALERLAKSGNVDAVILLNANPVYNSVFSAEMEALIKNAELSVSFSDRVDESAKHAQYVGPTSNYLESWDVLEPVSGEFCIVQPTIRNLFDTRTASEAIANLAGITKSNYDFVRSMATPILGSWSSAVKKGHVSLGGGSQLSVDSASTLAGVTGSGNNSGGIELYLYESVAIGNGNMVNNPLLQEVPDPISKVTWENYLTIPYQMAEAEGIKLWANYKKVPTADVTVNGTTVTVPVVVGFGLAPNTVSLALGYGRTDAGRAANGSGVNAYPFVSYDNGQVNYSASNVSITFNKVANYKLGIQQMYGTLMEDNALPMKEPQYRSGIVKETTLAAYKQDEHAGNEDREKILHHLQTLYGYHEYNGHHWGMGVDMNACIGCGACVVSCNVENNIPVVGKNEVYLSRSMHWMRIDRYFGGSKANPDVSFQPMMCQHCDNAPCENVCPVNATNHSSEGINQMAYNRCIGTRYCANNCPYKVRRFNWYDYQSNDLFGKANDLKDTTYMHTDIARMVLNPDVTVRTRGVIEKCSFCTQKIQESKLVAKSEGRKLGNNEVKTACQTACPTDAITFGDLNNKDSEVHDLFFNDGRNYHMLEEQHFLPSVGYQTKIRNKEEGPVKDFV